MRKEKRFVLSYLFNNDVDPQERLSIAKTVEDRFDCQEEYFVVPHIKKSLEKHSTAPSVDYMIDEKGWPFNDFQPVDVDNHADALEYLEQDWARKIKKELTETTTDFIDSGTEDPELLIDSVKGVLNQFESKIGTEEKPDIEELYEERKKTGGGLKTYIKPLDDMIGTLSFGEMSTIGGYTGMYKSSTVLHMMRRNMIQDGKNFVFLSLEMSRELMLYKIYSSFSYHPKWQDHEEYGNIELDIQDFKEINLTKDQEEFLYGPVKEDLRYNDDYGEFRILTQDDIKAWTTSSLRSQMARLDFKVDGIIIDYVQLFSEGHVPRNAGFTGKYAPNYLIQQLLPLTDDVDGRGNKCHLTLISQTTREGYDKALETGGKYPKQSMLYANNIEQNSAYMIFCWFPPMLANNKQIKYYLPKNRWGEEMEEPVQVQCLPSKGHIGNSYVSKDVEKDEDKLDGIL